MSSAKLQPVIPFALHDRFADVARASAAADDEVLLLFDEHAAKLRRYVASFDLGHEATEDILQEVFLSLHRHLLLGRPRTHLKAWLFRVGHNLALRQHQQRARRRENERGWSESLPERVIDPAANPEQRLTEERRRRRLRAVARALPERDRHCLYLRAEGLAYREIAKTLGVSLGSVAKSLARALARLSDADRE